MGVTVRVEGINDALQSFDSLPVLIQAGVKVSGDSTDYALVWEWGSATLTKPGPKTLWGTNPAGSTEIMTKTAPTGFIRVNTQEYISILKQELASVDLHDKPLSEWTKVLEEMMEKAGTRCAKLISDTAPIDTGRLRSEIQLAGVGDSLLESGSPNDYGDTELNLGTNWS